jgi:acyl dehydratase
MTLAHDYRIDTLNDHVGRDFGLTDGMLIDQPLIDQFAECSRDGQWVHVDTERAGKSALGTTIAHGLLTLSLTTAAQYELGVFPSDAAQVLNYGLDKVRFLSPVPSGSQIVIRVELTGAETKGAGRTLIRCRNTAYREGDLDRPVMVAESLYMLVA